MVGRRMLRPVAALAALVSLACPHISSPWEPTKDPGACVPLPDDPHSWGADPECHGVDSAAEAEPNGALFYEAQMGGAACSARTVMPGLLSTPNDVDLFGFAKCDLPFLSSDPLSRSTKLPTLSVDVADDGTETCMFAYCALGPTTLRGCPIAGTIPAHLEEGMLGCCRRDKGQLVTDVVCDSFQPQISGVIAVRSVESPTVHCHDPYSMTFSIATPPAR